MDLFLAALKPAEREEADKEVEAWRTRTANSLR
jgi:hypothetical protein